MKKLLLLTTGVLFCSAAIAMSSSAKLSYAMGYETGKNFDAHHIVLHEQAYTAGLHAALMGLKPTLSADEMRTVLMNFQKAQIQKMKKVEAKLMTKDTKSGETFLAENAKKAGVHVLKSGLQYKVLTAGEGAKPSATSTVTVNYQGEFTDGKVFDSSYKRGMPATFPVNGVIKGWTEALQMMPVGATWMLYIPSQLAYGARGMPGAIPPNATLVFKVHLISIK